MAKEVTIDINANFSGNSRGLVDDNSSVNAPASYNQSQQPQSLNTSAMPSYDRMAQDIRREILSRGAVMVPGSSNFNQLVSVVQQQQRDAAYKQIDDRYNQSVNQTQKDFENRRKTELDRLEDERQDKLSKTTIPSAIQRINDRYDRKTDRLNENIEIEKAIAFQQLGQERDNDKTKVEQDLVKIASEIAQELKQGNSNSYLGRLRQQYRDAIHRRDNAETEEDVQAASAEAADIQRQISKAMNNNTPMDTIRKMSSVWGIANGIIQGVNVFPRYYANEQEKINELRSAGNGDVFGTLEQDISRRRNNAVTAAGAIGTAVGAGIGGYLSGGIGAGVGAGLGGSALSSVTGMIYDAYTGDERNRITAGRLVSENEQRLMQYSDFANMVRRLNPNLASISSVRQYLTEYDEKTGEFNNNFKNEKTGLDNYDLGLSRPEFIEQVRQRLLQRGFINSDDYGFNQTLNSIAIEKMYNMNAGTLGQLSSYDRYGNNANQDAVNLIKSLESRGVMGMSGGQVLRANEFLGYQTQLLEMQKSWALNPNSNLANRMLLAAQDVYGNSLDSRGIQALGRINQAVTEPNHDYSEAILYNVIEKNFGTNGDLRKIREIQYSDDPEVREKLLKEFYSEIERIYGGADTTEGMLALGQVLGIKNPYEIRKWGKRLKEGLPLTGDVDVDSEIFNNSLKDYTPNSVKASKEAGDVSTAIIANKLDGLGEILNKIYSDFNIKINQIASDIHVLK